ncbi:MAG: flagellar biosynthesis protein FliQ [Burkholderiaceae bacterium]|jgi:flagellar biosynthetic protein FliQ
MDTATVIELARQALWMTILVSAPLLVVALVVGVTVGIFQAATSINEMTLSFIPKVVAMAATLAVVGSWQIGTLLDYWRAIFARIPGLFL